MSFLAFRYPLGELMGLAAAKSCSVFMTGVSSSWKVREEGGAKTRAGRIAESRV